MHGWESCEVTTTCVHTSVSVRWLRVNRSVCSKGGTKKSLCSFGAWEGSHSPLPIFLPFCLQAPANPVRPRARQGTQGLILGMLLSHCILPPSLLGWRREGSAQEQGQPAVLCCSPACAPNPHRSCCPWDGIDGCCSVPWGAALCSSSSAELQWAQCILLQGIS